MADKAITNKQRVWAEYYLQSWNLTEAARKAGYKGNDVTLASVGWENLRKPQIAEYVSERLAEIAMDSNEVLARLSQHARGTLDPFLTSSGDVDLTTEQAKANIHLIKKIRTKTRILYVKGSEEPIKEIETEIEIHDPQAALVHMGRYHKLFTEMNEQSGEVIIKIEREPKPIQNGQA